MLAGIFNLVQFAVCEIFIKYVKMINTPQIPPAPRPAPFPVDIQEHGAVYLQVVVKTKLGYTSPYLLSIVASESKLNEVQLGCLESSPVRSSPCNADCTYTPAGSKPHCRITKHAILSPCICQRTTARTGALTQC